jgi:hypothetical protein
VLPVAHTVASAPDGALAELRLDRKLRERAAGERQAAEAQSQYRRRDQHPPWACAGDSGHADCEEQPALDQDVVDGRKTDPKG